MGVYHGALEKIIVTTDETVIKFRWGACGVTLTGVNLIYM